MGSRSESHSSASDCEVGLGSSTGGMPSRGGPPDWNSDSGTLCFEKSVSQPLVSICSTSAGSPPLARSAVDG
jgi:hypothetical protein